MASHENICKYIHLPVQSGNSRVLELMNRTYDRDWYIERVNAIYSIMPDCAISSGCNSWLLHRNRRRASGNFIHHGIVEVQHVVHVCLFRASGYCGSQKNMKMTFQKRLKKRRLNEIIRLQNHLSLVHNKADIGKTFKVLIEGDSKKI